MDLNGYSYCYKVKYAKSGSPTTKKKHFKVILTSWMATSGAKTISYSSSKSTTCEVSAKAGISAKELSAELGIKYSYTVTKGITYTYNVDKKKGKYVRIVAYIDAKKYKVKKTSYYVDVVCKWTPFGSFMYNVYTQKTRIIYLYVPIIKNNNIYIQLEYKK